MSSFPEVLRISVGLLFTLVRINQLAGQLASCVHVYACVLKRSLLPFPSTFPSPLQNDGWMTRQTFSIVCFPTLDISIIVH